MNVQPACLGGGRYIIFLIAALSVQVPAAFQEAQLLSNRGRLMDASGILIKVLYMVLSIYFWLISCL